MDDELTWAGGLDLGLVLFGVRVEKVWGRVLTALYLALEGVQTLDVLFLERAGGAARRAHVQVGGQLPPLLVLVHLVGDTGRRRLRELHTHNSLTGTTVQAVFISDRHNKQVRCGRTCVRPPISLTDT